MKNLRNFYQTKVVFKIQINKEKEERIFYFLIQNESSLFNEIYNLALSIRTI